MEPLLPTFALSEQERGYVAGIIDGEGSIRFWLTPEGGAGWQVRVDNTNAAVLHWLKDHLGGEVSRWTKRGPRRKPIATWWLSGSAAVALCGEVESALVIKGEQARLLAQAYALKTARGEKRISPALLQERREFEERFRVLNQRGEPT